MNARNDLIDSLKSGNGQLLFLFFVSLFYSFFIFSFILNLTVNTKAEMKIIWQSLKAQDLRNVKCSPRKNKTFQDNGRKLSFKVCYYVMIMEWSWASSH